MFTKEMMFEDLILRIWEKTKRSADPFGLADADTYDREMRDFNNGRELMFSLEAGLRRLKNIHQDSEHSCFIEEMLEDFFQIKSRDDFDVIIIKTYKYINENQL